MAVIDFGSPIVVMRGPQAQAGRICARAVWRDSSTASGEWLRVELNTAWTRAYYQYRMNTLGQALSFAFVICLACGPRPSHTASFIHPWIPFIPIKPYPSFFPRHRDTELFPASEFATLENKPDWVRTVTEAAWRAPNRDLFGMPTQHPNV